MEPDTQKKNGVPVDKKAQEKFAQPDRVELTGEEIGELNAMRRRLAQRQIDLANLTVEYEHRKAALIAEIGSVGQTAMLRRLEEMATAHGLALDGSQGQWTFDTPTNTFTRKVTP